MTLYHVADGKMRILKIQTCVETLKNFFFETRSTIILKTDPLKFVQFFFYERMLNIREKFEKISISSFNSKYQVRNF